VTPLSDDDRSVTAPDDPDACKVMSKTARFRLRCRGYGKHILC
jgi:hypothetical protein